MRGLTIAGLILTVGLLLTSCIKQVDVETRNEKPILVVEGEITTDSVPYIVSLTYSGKYTSTTRIPDDAIEKDAIVTITDDAGNSTELSYTADGKYETIDPAYIGQVGKSYHVTVKLKNGTTYISAPEKIAKPVPVGSINVAYSSHFDIYYPSKLIYTISVQDPADDENYYKWNFYGWTMRQTQGVPCGFGCIEFVYCYQKVVDDKIRILSDNSLNGNEIRNLEIGSSYIYTFGNDFIDIGQVSLTREAYQFWERYNDQTTRTGSILDPLPASIKGNVFNEANPDDFALGYFSASSVTHKRAEIIPYSITQYWLDLSATQFIPPGSGACFDYFPDALSYPPQPARQYPPPDGWENAEQIDVYW